MALQDSSCAEWKHPQTLQSRDSSQPRGAMFQLWNGFNHHFPANPTFFSYWMPPVHFYIFILGSQISTDVLNRNICESDLFWRAELHSRSVDYEIGCKRDRGSGDAGAPSSSWHLATARPGSRRAAALGGLQLGISKIFVLATLP